jgi:hypothetical protein
MEELMTSEIQPVAYLRMGAMEKNLSPLLGTLLPVTKVANRRSLNGRSISETANRSKVFDKILQNVIT